MVSAGSSTLSRLCLGLCAEGSICSNLLNSTYLLKCRYARGSWVKTASTPAALGREPRPFIRARWSLRPCRRVHSRVGRAIRPSSMGVARSPCAGGGMPTESARAPIRGGQRATSGLNRCVPISERPSVAPRVPPIASGPLQSAVTVTRSGLDTGGTSQARNGAREGPASEPAPRARCAGGLLVVTNARGELLPPQSLSAAT
jgi:hypothetical protein